MQNGNAAMQKESWPALPDWASFRNFPVVFTENEATTISKINQPVSQKSVLYIFTIKQTQNFNVSKFFIKSFIVVALATVQVDTIELLDLCLSTTHYIFCLWFKSKLKFR